MTPLLQNILTRHDANESVAAIALACQVSVGYVYGILRKYRKDRTRKPRERTSERRRLIAGLSAQGIPPGRVAYLAQCSEQYVYRIIKEQQQ